MEACFLVPFFCKITFSILFVITTNNFLVHKYNFSIKLVKRFVTTKCSIIHTSHKSDVVFGEEILQNK